MQQVRDYRHAITYAGTLDEVDPTRIGVWGSSYSGGHVLVLGAIDRRVKAVVAQVPLVSGSANIAELVRADFRAGFRQMFDDDRAARFRGDPPAMVPVVAEDPLAPSALPTPDSWTWFTETGKTRAPSWKNEVTLRTVEMLGEYEPAAYIARISPTPLLMVVAARGPPHARPPRHRRLRARPRAQAPGDPAGRPLRRLRRRLRRGQRPRPRLVRRAPRGRPLMGTKLQDKVVVVTGASSGFGRAIAKACAAEGAKVVVSDVHENPNAGGFEDDAALTTVEAIEKLGGAGTYVGCDVTKEDQVDRLVAETVRAYGRIDVMVNNAGVYRNGKRLHEFDEADLDVCYEVNVKGTFFGAKAAIRQMLEQGDGGVIVNLVSTAGLQGHPNQSVYNISKGAQANLTRCLAIEYGKDRIRVNGICPTYAKTSLTRRAVRRQGLRPGLHRVDPAQAVG